MLFHKKDGINEAIVELDTNSLYATVMTEIKIPKDKQTRIVDKEKVGIDDYNTEPGKQGPSDIIIELENWVK
jgi:hypothetical protein